MGENSFRFSDHRHSFSDKAELRTVALKARPNDLRVAAWARTIPDNRNDAQARSPRAQAIARHRREMMELVKSVPESAYELSLKDIVELAPHVKPSSELETVKEQRRAKDGAAERMAGSVSMETRGFLLRMFVPARSMGRRMSFGGGGGSDKRSKVSPKPVVAEEEESRGGGEAAESEFGEASPSYSFDSTNSSTRRKMVGCYPFLPFRRK